MYLSFIALRQFGYVNVSSKLLAMSFHFSAFWGALRYRGTIYFTVARQTLLIMYRIAFFMFEIDIFYFSSISKTSNNNCIKLQNRICVRLI